MYVWIQIVLLNLYLEFKSNHFIIFYSLVYHIQEKHIVYIVTKHIVEIEKKHISKGAVVVVIVW